MSWLHTQPSPNSGSVCRGPGCLRLVLIECVLLTCPGTLCRRIDEARSTWRQCRGKGCLEPWASWAEKVQIKRKKKYSQTLSRSDNGKLFHGLSPATLPCTRPMNPELKSSRAEYSLPSLSKTFANLSVNDTVAVRIKM